MNRKKFISVSVAAAVLAGVVTFSACKKDDKDDPVADGKKAAQEECACFDHLSPYRDVWSYEDLTSTQQASFDAAEEKTYECFETLRKKYKKYFDAETEDPAFLRGYDEEDGKCNAWGWNLMPWWL